MSISVGTTRTAQGHVPAGVVGVLVLLEDGILHTPENRSFQLVLEVQPGPARSCQLLEGSGPQDFVLKDVNSRETTWSPQASKAERSLISAASLWGEPADATTDGNTINARPQTGFKLTTRKTSRNRQEDSSIYTNLSFKLNIKGEIFPQASVVP